MSSLMPFYYDPFSGFDRLFDEAFFSRFLHPATGGPPTTETRRRELFRPRYVVNSPCLFVTSTDVDGCRMDVHENRETNTVTATFDLPGIKSDDVNIDVNHDMLTISGDTSTSEQRDEHGFTVRERSWGKFSRTLMLPQGTKVSVVEIWVSLFLLSNENRLARRGQGEDGKRGAECDIPQGSTSAAAQAHHHRVSALSSKRFV